MNNNKNKKQALLIICKVGYTSPINCYFSIAQGSVDEEPDDHWRRPQVQANLCAGHLFSGNP